MPNIGLNLFCGPREPEKADEARSLMRFANGLPEFDPIYSSWLRKPQAGAEVFSLPVDEAEARQLLQAEVFKFDDGRLWPELGSHIGAGHAGPPPYDFRPSSYADISGTIGASATKAMTYPNYLWMRLSDVRPSTGRPWRASELRPLMKFAREIWRPSEMYAKFAFQSCPMIADPSFASGRRHLRPRIGWITYLPPELAARARYPADVEIETLDDGAALVTLCEEPFDKSDAAGLARLHELETALRPIQT